MNYFRDIVITTRGGGKLYLGRILLGIFLLFLALFIGLC